VLAGISDKSIAGNGGSTDRLARYQRPAGHFMEVADQRVVVVRAGSGDHAARVHASKPEVIDRIDTWRRKKKLSAQRITDALFAAGDRRSRLMRPQAALNCKELRFPSRPTGF
jgi:hypothetical protein